MAAVADDPRRDSSARPPKDRDGKFGAFWKRYRRVIAKYSGKLHISVIYALEWFSGPTLLGARCLRSLFRNLQPRAVSYALQYMPHERRKVPGRRELSFVS